MIYHLPKMASWWAEWLMKVEVLVMHATTHHNHSQLLRMLMLEYTLVTPPYGYNLCNYFES